MRKIHFATLKGLAIFAALIVFSIQSTAAENEEFNVAEVYQARCYACHGTGMANAPLLGDAIEWEIRMEKGMETVMRNVIDGLNGLMPAKGLCAECSDDELKALVDYILENSQ